MVHIYRSTYNTCNDVIIINNKDKLDCTVNIVKQKTISDQSELSTKESTYKAYVKVSEREIVQVMLILI